MRRGLRILAVLLAVGALAFWAGKGANRGWTKNQVEKRTVDEITGIEAISYEKEFVPGVEFLGGALLGAGILAAVSFAFRDKRKT
jgi:hypothetical protein